MESPVFTIVIPTYNRGKFIGSTISSVLAQSYVHFELIIIDDGSTDNTADEVSIFRDDRIIYIKKENEERAVARNTGARLAKGQYVNFLDSDDYLYPHHLQTAFDFINKSNSARVFHLGFDVKSPSGKFFFKMDNIKSINKQIIHGNVLSCNGVFIDKMILLENPFNEDRSLSTLEDWELWIRLSSRFHFVPVNVITSTILLHDERSVVVGNTEKIKTKGNLFVKYVSQDAINQRVYGNLLRITYSSVYMYVSLHLAMAGGKSSEVLLYLRKGISHHLPSFFTKRFLVIVRFLLFKR